MRAHVNNLVQLLRPPGKLNVSQLWVLRQSRQLHSDAANGTPAAPAVKAAAEAAPLSDRLGRRHNYLRVSLTERCNLRCKYCMPAGGVPLSPRSALLSRAELARLVRVLAQLGVDKVRLTGGEPTLRKDLPDIIRELSSVAGIRAVSMTTNGLVLTRQLPALQRAGLAALNVSLDSLRPQRYEAMARRPGLSRVLAGIDLALQLGYRPVKINTVLMKGFNDDEIGDFVEFTRDREVEVRFIEFMPFSGNEWEGGRMVPQREALRALTDRHPDVRPLLPGKHDTSRMWQVPGFSGRVGFISSMTENFCSTCNRLRLTADGNLKVCLFGAAEVSLRDALRRGASDGELEQLVRTALNNKKPQHAAAPGPRPRRFPRPPPSVLALLAASGPAVHSARAYCSGSSALTHLDEAGRVRMVDVGAKPETQRRAAAECSLRVSGRLLRLLRDARLPKGDALSVARVAGVLAAKRTHDLIPMCHPLPLACARVSIQLPPGDGARGGLVAVRSEVSACARTGAEMEALTAAAVAALALYDMCKSVDRGMRITDLRVVSKSGGASGDWPREDPPASPDEPPAHQLRRPDTSPLRPAEPFVPSNFMHF